MGAATSPLPSFDALPNEIQLQITQHAVTSTPEHAASDDSGHYRPARFNTGLRNVSHTSRKILEDTMCRKFAFLEVRFTGCREHGVHDSVIQGYRRAFGFSQYRKLAALEEHHKIPLSTIRMDVSCSSYECEGPRMPVILIFTQATPFANLMACAMVQRTFGCRIIHFESYEFEVTLRAQSPQMSTPILNTLDTMRKYLHLFRVTRVNGVANELARDFINTVNRSLATLGGLINLYETHIQEVESLRAAGLPIETILPLALRFLLAYEREHATMRALLTNTGTPNNRTIFDYLRSLELNYMDMVSHGLANYLLLRPANVLHHLMTDTPFDEVLEMILTRSMNMIYRYEYQQNPMFLLNTPSQTEWKRPVKLENLYKTQILFELALARACLFSETDMSERVREALNRGGRSIRSSMQNVSRCMSSLQKLVVDPLDQKIDPHYNHLTTDPEVNGLTDSMKKLNIQVTDSTVENTMNILGGLNSELTTSIDTLNASHTAENSLTEDDLTTYNHTRVWLQQTNLIKNAIERAASDSISIREKGLAVISQPLLHNTTLWSDIANLAPDETQKDKHVYMSLRAVPESFASAFQQRLSELMNEYELPFPVTDEDREEAHEEIRRLGYEI